MSGILRLAARSATGLLGIMVLSLVAAAALACSDSADESASPEEIVSQFRVAVGDNDLATIAELLALDVVHSEFVQDSATGEREHWAPDIVGREAVVELYGMLGPAPESGGPMPPQGEAVMDSPDTQSVDERVVVQTKSVTHSTGFFTRLIVETEVSGTGLIEHLSVIHEVPNDGVNAPTPTEAADFLNAIHVRHGLPKPVTDAEGEYGFYRGNPPCQEPEDGMEGNDPELLAAQLEALASGESPVWLLAAQSLAEARSYCPARFWEYREVVEAAIGNTDADRAFEWATVPVE